MAACALFPLATRTTKQHQVASRSSNPSVLDYSLLYWNPSSLRTSSYPSLVYFGGKNQLGHGQSCCASCRAASGSNQVSFLLVDLLIFANSFFQDTMFTRTSAFVQKTAVRAFSDSASHKPVLTLHGLQARYANATYIAASKAGQLDKVEGDLKSLRSASQTSKKFSQLLENPLISRDEKTKFVNGIDKIAPITKKLLVTMAGNARLSELPKVASIFAQLMKAKRGEVDAKIISAQKLSAAELKEVQAAMKSHVPAGKTVVIEAVEDPSIVGGLQVQIGDQFLDLSVKSRIEEFAKMPVD